MEALQKYLSQLCPLILDFMDNTILIAEFTDSLNKAQHVDVLKQYISDSTCSALFVEYISASHQFQKDAAESTPSTTFTFSLEPTPANGRRVVSLSLVKCHALPIETKISIASQVRVIKLLNNASNTSDNDEKKDSDGTEKMEDSNNNNSEQHGLQALYDFVHYTFVPLVRSHAGGKVNAENTTESNSESKKNNSSNAAVAKSLKEFEYALKNCMQHTEIPEVHFTLEPEIIVAIKQCNDEMGSKGGEGGRPTLDELGFQNLEDSEILIRLANSVKRWTIDIQKITNLDRDINKGAGAVSEINFWKNMEIALDQIQLQIQSIGVEITLDILNREKQFYVTIPFKQDTGLTKTKKKVEGYMFLLRDFPINSILTSSDIKQMTNAIVQIFNHLRKMKSANYPVERSFRLLEAISRDLTYQLIEILGNDDELKFKNSLMNLKYDHFIELTNGCDLLFRTWDEQSSHFRELARDIAKKRGENRGTLPTRLSLEHRLLQQRIEDVNEFRKNHEKLRDVISKVLPSKNVTKDFTKDVTKDTKINETKTNSTTSNNSNNSNTLLVDTASSSGSSSATDDVNAAYQHVLGIDVLDVSKEGIIHWDSAKRNYEIRIDRVESQITEKLTDLLATAKTGDEKFRVFSKFNVLFFRHRIRGAIQQHQSELIKTVKDDISQLQNMFKKSYTRSEAERMSTVRDLPPMSGKIIWAKQIERQLTMYISRIEAVLGKDWERHTDGRNLKTICDSFRRKLDTQPIFDEWMARINIARQSNPNFEVNGNIFSIVPNSNNNNSIENNKKEKKRDSMDTTSNALSSTENNKNSNNSSSSSKSNSSTETTLMLKVSFDPDIIMLFKEVRNLHWLNSTNTDRNHFRVPYTLKIISDEAKEKYPYAMALNETLRTYTSTLLKVNDSLRPLVAGLHRSVQSKIHGAFKNHIRWDSEGLEMYVKELSEQIYSLSERVSDLLTKIKTIYNYISELSTCKYEYKAFNDILLNVQKIVDELNLEEYTNLDVWTLTLEKDISLLLKQRLKYAIVSWCNAIEYQWKSDGDANTVKKELFKEKKQDEKDEKNEKDAKDEKDAKEKAQVDFLLEYNALSKEVLVVSYRNQLLKELPDTIHELRLRNNVLVLSPPLKCSRVLWHTLLNNVLQVITSLPRIQSSRYDNAFSNTTYDSPSKRALGGMTSGRGGRGGREEEKEEYNLSLSFTTYTSILNLIETSYITYAYNLIENVMEDITEYVQNWYQYQALWDMTPSVVYETLGDSVSKWQQLLREIKKARSTFDNHEIEKCFGFFIIHYGSVQSKVSEKYDNWHRDMLSKFGALLSTNMRSFHELIQNNRSNLEIRTLDSDVIEIIEYITSVQLYRREMNVWESSLETFKTSQRLLQSQRYPFPSDWMWLANIEGEWNAFTQILNRKWNEMKLKIPSLQKRILEEDRLLEISMNEIETEWKNERNNTLMVSTVPTEALRLLSSFDTRLNTMNSDYNRILKALDALDLNTPSSNPITHLLIELNGFQDVWKSLSSIWSSMIEVREMNWRSIVPRKIQKSLDSVLKKLDGLSPKIQQYEAFQNMKAKTKKYKTSMLLLSELRSDALKDRHWRKVIKILNLQLIKNNLLTLGDLLDSGLKEKEKLLKDIIIQAQGEMALEQFLSDLRDEWTSAQLELVDYQNKTSLIRGWEDLFSKLEDHLSSLSSMKQSPYFKIFEDECNSWEEKLTRLKIILDLWIDVQRRWIYLEGIFYGSADIKQQLPNEFARFKSIDQEFILLMRNVRSKPSVLNLLSMSNTLRTLERLSELLDKIQRALGSYLEKQRSHFPRFYFVGDEDLLEIIGNSKEPIQVQRHISKMFAAIASLECEIEGEGSQENNGHYNLVKGMSSREGEIVTFDSIINVNVSPKINVWLSLVETQMQVSLSTLLQSSIVSIPKETKETNENQATNESNKKHLLEWIHNYPAQIILLASSINWSTLIETAFNSTSNNDDEESNDGTASCNDHLSLVLSSIITILTLLADQVLNASLLPSRRKKYEQLITEYVHQRDSTRALIEENVNDQDNFDWLYQLRYYFEDQNSKSDTSSSTSSSTSSMIIKIANASFQYGFEYLGVAERLVQTPLTDRCYLTLTQALHMRMGGNPFGPAGTGKTESVKMLGAMLGRFVLVFNCDESFDFNAMGRIFVGLCQVGAWGCFDEFNRLEERILSAVSQQILVIQNGLQREKNEITLLGKNVMLNSNVGIFVTMNPGYAGRSNLPDNLKQLFRGVAMMKPDYALIAQVVMFSQGFRTAEILAGKVVLLFSLCMNQLSVQPHYDFGLRALKSVLASAGNLKRETLMKSSLEEGKDEKDEKQEKEEKKEKEQKNSLSSIELSVLMQSVCETILPKLVSNDIHLFHNLLKSVFPSATISSNENQKLTQHIQDICQLQEYNYVPVNSWMEKVMQLYQVQHLRHGVMMVGPSGVGKTSAWRTLLLALEKYDNIKSESYVIDAKAITKEELYGRMDSTTLEWTDGVFTHILRTIINNVRNESSKRHWIVFDCDVDPEWAENLNSVLDDNKLLTLPSGERLSIPPNVRIMFETETLRYATLATVSRCGMIWFSKNVLPTTNILQKGIEDLRRDGIHTGTAGGTGSGGGGVGGGTAAASNSSSDSKKKKKKNAPSSQLTKEEEKRRNVQNVCVDSIASYFTSTASKTSLMLSLLNWSLNSKNVSHVMEVTRVSLIMSTCSLLKRGINNVLDYNENRRDFPMTNDKIIKYMKKWFIFSILWGLGGSMNNKDRILLGNHITNVVTDITLPKTAAINDGGSGGGSAGGEGGPVVHTLIDYEVDLSSSEWRLWLRSVPLLEIESHQVLSTDVVISTVDTVRHVVVLHAWLQEHRPLILCGPPGSGKSMTLTSVLSSSTNMELASLNFSSSTTPSLILKTFEQYCTYTNTRNGPVLAPSSDDNKKWLVVFCDEINLPENDAYGTQSVIMLMRQLTEQNGFWRKSDNVWVTIDRIQFVGACNPPTDPGRVVMSSRFLRHAPLLFVDYPATESLRQIYGTFSRGLLKLQPSLRAHSNPLTESMVSFYNMNSEHFTSDNQPHYVYSPRELSRWCRAIYEAIHDQSDMSLEELVRVWLHEGLR